jgi:hypothetical protein
MKILTSSELDSFAPSICNGWREEQYPHTLAAVLLELVKVRKRPPEGAFHVIADYAEEWLKARLLTEYSATAFAADRRKVVGALMNEVVDAAGRMEREDE